MLAEPVTGLAAVAIHTSRDSAGRWYASVEVTWPKPSKLADLKPMIAKAAGGTALSREEAREALAQATQGRRDTDAQPIGAVALGAVLLEHLRAEARRAVHLWPAQHI